MRTKLTGMFWDTEEVNIEERRIYQEESGEEIIDNNVDTKQGLCLSLSILGSCQRETIQMGRKLLPTLEW